MRNATLGREASNSSALGALKGFEEEEIIALSDAQEYLSECPKCKSEFHSNSRFSYENFRLIPANCQSYDLVKGRRDSNKMKIGRETPTITKRDRR